MAVVIELWERELLNERFGSVYVVRKEAMRQPNPIPKAETRDTPGQKRWRRKVLLELDKPGAVDKGVAA